MSVEGFPVATCPACNDVRLLCWDVDSRGDLVAQCTECGAAVPRSEVNAATMDELIELGYPVDGAPVASGERGCRGGQCGVQQPPVAKHGHFDVG